MKRAIVLCVVSSLCVGPMGLAQTVSMKNATPQKLAGIAKDNSRHFGDDPEDGGPLATDLQTSLRPAAVAAAMKRVADWQLEQSQPYFDRIWTWSVFLLARSEIRRMEGVRPQAAK